MLVAAGVDPQMVEWFGRWRSESVRSYTEDARAQAPQASRIAGLVKGAAPCTPAPGVAGQVPRTPAGGNVGAPGTPAWGPQMHHAAGSSAVAFAQEDGASLLGIEK
jgi:hypothetical protein